MASTELTYEAEPAERGVDWRLPARNRRWIIRYGLAMTALVNLVVNGVLAWVSTIGARHLDLLTMPLVSHPSLITNTVGTFVILPAMTSVICSFGVRGYRRRGSLDPMGWPASGRLAWLSRLPSSDVRAGLVLGTWTAVVLGPVSCNLLIAFASSGVSRGWFVLYNALLGVGLGAVITPLVAIRAMAQPVRRTSQ